MDKCHSVGRYARYVEKGGTDRMKHEEIDSQVFEKFEAAKQGNLTVHSVDLQQWAYQVCFMTSILDFDLRLQFSSNQHISINALFNVIVIFRLQRNLGCHFLRQVICG